MKNLFLLAVMLGIASFSTSALASAKNDYDYARSLGYLYGDGKIVDGKLSFIKKSSGISKHLAYTAGKRFDDKFTSKGNRYFLKSSALGVSGLGAQGFLDKGVPLNRIKDKRAFITSIIETEGAVRVGRVMDDPSFKRCDYVRDMINSMNSQCSTSKCNGPSCKPANCAFIATGKKRGTPYKRGFCGVYLSGKASDWKSYFGNKKFWFVSTGRIPGGEQRKRDAKTRPFYARVKK